MSKEVDEAFELRLHEVAVLSEHPDALQILIDYHDNESAAGEAMGYDVSYHNQRVKELKAAKAKYEQDMVVMKAGEVRDETLCEMDR